MDWARRMQGTKNHDCETLRLYGSNLKLIRICSSVNYIQKWIGLLILGDKGGGVGWGAQNGAAAQQGSEK